MKCRFPVECAAQFRSRNVAADAETVSALARHCAAFIAPRFAAVSFLDQALIDVCELLDPVQVEKSLATWALSRPVDWTWLAALTQSQGGLANWLADLQSQASGANVHLRPAQVELASRASKLASGSISVLEASTGLGKTLVFAMLAKSLASNERIVIAVPTLAVGQQWQSVWAQLGMPLLDEVWGKARYGEGQFGADMQAQALERAAVSPAVLCSHHVLSVVADNKKITSLFVDEAHLLDVALARMSGLFFPIEMFGPRLLDWYRQSVDGVMSGGDVELTGHQRASVVARALLNQPGDANSDDRAWRASIVATDAGTPLVWLNTHGLESGALQDLWPKIGRAWLFSGTLSERTPAGFRSVATIKSRLLVPPKRFQDLGCVRAAWRDTGVVVMTPEVCSGADARLWLSAHRDRKALWRSEVASFVQSCLGNETKMLLLINSYADIEALQALMPQLQGVIYSSRDISFDALRERFASKETWLWVATGAAWAGMDLPGLSHLAIGALPLPDPSKLESGDSLRHAAIDSVNKFKQGVGRLVRSDSPSASRSLRVSILDGRLNEQSRAWRKICQPIRQVLGDEFEDHGYFRRIKAAEVADL